MRKIFIVIAVCVYIAGFGASGYCQYTEGDDSAIEQTESNMGHGLDSELSGEEAPNTAEEGTANEKFAAGEPMTL